MAALSVFDMLPVVDETTPLTLGSDASTVVVEDEELNLLHPRENGVHALDEGDEEPHRQQRSRTGSFFEEALESIVEVKEAIVETLEEVKETITEGIVELKEIIGEEIVPVKEREKGDHSRKLGAATLAVLVFYKVSGGPFGCEPSVRAAGPFVALMGFFLMPFFWCAQEVLVTAELGSAYPEPSGAIAWVEEAFGPKAGLLAGFFHYVSGATDNAIYPSLFLNYVAAYTHTEGLMADGLFHFVIAATITIGLSVVNFLGLEIVGKLSTVVCVLSMAPFVLLVLISIPKIDPSRWLIMPDPTAIDDSQDSSWFSNPVWLGVMWRPLLNNLFWNLNSFDVGASFAGHVRNPETVFPRAMFMSLFLVSIGYLLPLMAALGATDTEQKDWDAGYLTVVATEAGGSWLGVLLVFSAAISNIAQFEAELSADAYQLMGMGDRGLVPKLFTKRSRFDTPTNGIILGTLIIIFLSATNFDQLVEMMNFAVSFSMLMEFAAFIKLRITDPDVERPYRIPLNTAGCVLFLLPSLMFLVYIILVASIQTYIYFACICAVGFLFHWMQKFAKHYHFLEYVEAPRRSRGRDKASIH